MGGPSGDEAFPPFLGPPEPCPAERARVHVLPVPFERTSSYVWGSEGAPSAVLRASQQVELYDEELGLSPHRVGIHTLPPFRPAAPTQEGAMEELEAHFRKVLERAPFVAMLSSEHSVTVPMVRALAPRHPGLVVVQIDAHSDLRDEYDGTRYSHACAMRRVVETCPVVAVGVRSQSEEEAEALPDLPVTTLYAREIAGRGDWSSRLLEAVPPGAPVYVTVDMDGFDPSLVPAVGTPEPGGLGWHETLAALRALCGKRRVVGFDVLELCPREQDEPSAFTAARLVYKLIGYSIPR